MGYEDWSTKLTRGLKTEAATGFQSRRGSRCDPTPVTNQHAPFATYKAAHRHPHREALTLEVPNGAAGHACLSEFTSPGLFSGAYAHGRCADLFRRQDGTYGFEEF